MRPPCLPRRGLALAALAGRGGKQRVLGGHPAAAAAVEPARHALRDARGAQDARPALRPEHHPVRRRRGSAGRPRAAAAGRAGGRRARLMPPPARARRPRPGATWRERQLQQPLAELAERGGVAGGEEARTALAPGAVPEALARQRLGDLAGGLLGREDERHLAAEDALEHRPDERVVGAAEDDRVAAGLLERRGVLGDRRRRSASPASISGTSFGQATALKRTPASRAADERLVAPRARRSPRSRAARCAGCGSRAPQRRPRARSRRHRHGERRLERRQRGRGGGVAGDDDQLDALGARGRRRSRAAKRLISASGRGP